MSNTRRAAGRQGAGGQVIVGRFGDRRGGFDPADENSSYEHYGQDFPGDAAYAEPYGADSYGAGPYGTGPYGTARESGGEAAAAKLAAEAVRVCAIDVGWARYHADSLLGPGRPPAWMVADALRALLEDGVDGPARHGWAPPDLAAIVRRQAGAAAVRPLVEALHTFADRVGHGALPPGWVAGLDDLSTTSAPAAGRAHADLVAPLLAAAATLRGLPPITFVSAATLPDPGGAGTKHLSRVRALLAKAESTTFPEEADALTAKAQELITRHALDGLLAPDPAIGGSAETGEAGVRVRRLWLDSPYVEAKAALVGAVAAPNRCRSVFNSLGFCVLVGRPRDLDAVELLVTSLLAQADVAMLRFSAALGGPGRVRAFRRAFLLSYAARIGQRLTESARVAIVDTGRADRLLPILARRSEEVAETFTRLFPTVVTRNTSVGSHAGWAAGHAAADLARLCAHEPLDGA